MGKVIAFIFQDMTTILAAPLLALRTPAFLSTLNTFSLSFYFCHYEKDHSNQYRTLTGLDEFDITTLKPVVFGLVAEIFLLESFLLSKLEYMKHHPRCDTYTLQVSNSHKTIITRFPPKPH